MTHYTERPWEARHIEISDSWCVCAVEPMRGRIDSVLTGMTEGNARLIAASPDLVEALTLALRLIENEREVLERSFLPEPGQSEAYLLTEYEQVIDAAKKAIEKATGLK